MWGTGRSGPSLLDGCLGGDTPVNLSGRGCYCADVNVCASVLERNQRERRDRVGATGWGRQRRRRSKRESEWEIFVGSLLDPPQPPRCLRKRKLRTVRSSSRARSPSEFFPVDFMNVMHVWMYLGHVPPPPVLPKPVSCFLYVPLSSFSLSVVVQLLLHYSWAERKLWCKFA